MYQCKEIIELTSKNMNASLPLWVRMEMKLHFLVCKTCKRYARQLQFINKVLGSLDDYVPTDGCQLSTDAKQRIAKKMHQAQETERLITK